MSSKAEIATGDCSEINEVSEQVLSVIAERFSGPLPPPETMAAYDKILPGAAEKILNMAVNQSDHRMSMEKKMVEADIRDGRLGEWFAFIISMTAIIGGFLVMLFVKGNTGTIVGGVFGIAGLGSVISVFITGTRRIKDKSKESNEE